VRARHAVAGFQRALELGRELALRVCA